MSDFSLPNFQMFNNGVEWRSDYVKENLISVEEFASKEFGILFSPRKSTDVT